MCWGRPKASRPCSNGATTSAAWRSSLEEAGAPRTREQHDPGHGDEGKGQRRGAPSGFRAPAVPSVATAQDGRAERPIDPECGSGVKKGCQGQPHQSAVIAAEPRSRAPRCPPDPRRGLLVGTIGAAITAMTPQKKTARAPAAGAPHAMVTRSSRPVSGSSWGMTCPTPRRVTSRKRRTRASA